MKKIILFVIGLALFAGCAALQRARTGTFKIKDSIFLDLDVCFIAYDLNTNKVLAERGGASCTERVPACSTFKIPLALMAYDAGLLHDEFTPMKWDGVESSIPAWNHDQTAATWMRDSVVWYSQQLTPKLGLAKIASYLKMFSYGNQDFSGGITTAWLTPKTPGNIKGSGTLKISAREQLEFLKNFWKQNYKISPNAYDKTNLILQFDTLEHGYNFSGKTGSGYMGQGSRVRVGWFLGRVEGHGNDIITILKFTDNDTQSLGRLAGPQAKELTLKVLKSNGL